MSSPENVRVALECATAMLGRATPPYTTMELIAYADELLAWLDAHDDTSRPALFRPSDERLVPGEDFNLRRQGTGSITVHVDDPQRTVFLDASEMHSRHYGGGRQGNIT